MSERVTQQQLNFVFQRYVDSLVELGVSVEGLSLISGDKVNGNSFKLRHKDGKRPVGVDSDGFLGWTKREAYDTLQTICRTIGDVA